MSTKERPRDKDEKTAETDVTSNNKKDQQSVEDWLDKVDVSVTSTQESTRERVETVNSTSSTTKQDLSVEQDELLLKKFIQQLPNWIEKPWMYVKPTHEGHLANWISGWREIILSYSRILAQHIINIYELQETHPFKNSKTQRQLSTDHMVFLIQRMVDDNLAKWLDEEIMARVYYKSDQEWSLIIYEYMIDTGMAAEVLTIYELKQLGEEWSTLPQSELVIILDLLVENDQATWVGAERDTIKFNI